MITRLYCITQKKCWISKMAFVQEFKRTKQEQKNIRAYNELLHMTTNEVVTNEKI